MQQNKIFPLRFILILFLIIVLLSSGMARGNEINDGSRPSSWAAETINKAKSNNLTTPKTSSGYQGHITREEFCELVMKLYEATYSQTAEPASPNPFNDTINQEILKAYNLNIVNGFGEGRFAPEEKITREQLACMFNNYLNIGFQYQGNPPQLGFKDGNNVSSWAQKAVQVMVDLNILGGIGDNLLDPKGYATREQAIVLVVRVYDMVQEAKGALPEVSDNNLPEQVQGSDLEERSKEEIINKWESLQLDYSSNPFAELPSVSSPYATGKLNDSYLQDTVKLTNFIRFLAGLPDDLILDEILISKAQHAAVLEAAVGYGGHYPEQPADMDDDFYSIAAEAARTCNLSLEVDSLEGYHRLLSAVNNWMYDGTGERNASEVAHRRWILFPPVKKIGLGYATGSQQYGVGHYGTMYTQDKSRGSKVDYDYIAWPNPGYMPNFFFKAFVDYQTPYPWSVFINPEKYQAPDKDEITVTVTRLKDQKKWVLDKNDIKSYDQFSQGYFNVKNINYGVKYIIVFSTGLKDFQEGEEFEVHITGLKSKAGQPAEINYTTKFFEIE